MAPGALNTGVDGPVSQGSQFELVGTLVSSTCCVCRRDVINIQGKNVKRLPDIYSAFLATPRSKGFNSWADHIACLHNTSFLFGSVFLFRLLKNQGSSIQSQLGSLASPLLSLKWD